MKKKYWSFHGKAGLPRRNAFATRTRSIREQRSFVRGFTLIELIIVMVILGILATVFVAQYPASLDRSRDTQRQSDSKQYQTALESYASRNNGLYPVQTSAVLPSSLCATLGLTSCPNDPKNGLSVCNGGVCRYQYVSNAAGTSFGLWARLQRPTSTSVPYFIVCSNGKTGEGSSVPTSANTCPI